MNDAQKRENANTMSEVDSGKPYGSRGQNRGEEVALDVRLQNGDAWGFSYSYLLAWRFHAEAGQIVLVFPAYEVKVNGRNLRSLYDLLLQRHVRWLQESGPQQAKFAEEGEAVITSIKIEER